MSRGRVSTQPNKFSSESEKIFRKNSNEIKACVEILNGIRMAESAAQKSHAMETVTSKGNPFKDQDDNPRTENWDKKKSRYNRKDQQPWKRNGSQSGYGGGNWRGDRRRGDNRRSKSSTENINPREDKPIIFDLSSGRSKMELNDWFKNTAPSKICRSDGVGWIYILSETIANEDRKRLFESYEGIVSLKQEWSKINENPENEVTFETFKDMAEKHDCKHGKWTVHAPQVDDIWQNLALAFAYDKFPKGAIAIKVSPFDDLDTSGKNEHLICVINKDMSDETEVFGVEKSLRNIPIRGELMYKPNIYTELGIYRSNKFGIRPTIYKSVKKVVGGDSGFEIQNIAKDEWLYRHPKTTTEQDDSVKDENNNDVLEDIQAKLSSLRLAMDNVGEAVSSFIKQQRKEKNKDINKKTKEPVVDESIKIDVTEEEIGAKETGKDNENKIGSIKEDGTIVDDMKIDEQDIKKKKSSREIKKKKGKNTGKKDLKEEDIDKKVDIIKEDDTTKADAVGGTKEKDVANKDTKAVDDKLNIIKENNTNDADVNQIQGKVDIKKNLEKGDAHTDEVKEVNKKGNGNKEADGGDGGVNEKVDAKK